MQTRACQYIQKGLSANSLRRVHIISARITLNQLYKKYGDKFSAKAKDLKDSNGQEGRPFEARFLQPGLVKYDFGVCLLKKETIDKFIDTFIGKPVIIDHKDDIALEDRKGGIEKI